ncbi:MAG: DUF2079 domain-containing protein [Oscillospiraceae bacterium]
MRYGIRNNAIYSLCSAYVYTVLLTLLFTKQDPLTKEFIQNYTFLWQILSFFLLAIGFFLVSFALKKLCTGATVAGATIAAVYSVILELNVNFYYAAMLCALIAVIVLRYWKPVIPLKMNNPAAWLTVGVLYLLMSALIGYGTTIRYLSYGSSNYDMGIFSQMFENMAKTGIQYTTVERNDLLSHFHVHFSPIFYALLPVYMLFRTPAVLPVLQALVVYSGVFPLVKLCGIYGASPKQKAAAGAVYLLYPAFGAACFYDIHENMFLPALLLWLFVCLEKNRRIGATIVTLLTLCVKEDTGLFVVIIGLFGVFAFKNARKLSVGVVLAGTAGFVLTNRFVNQFGEGVKVNRYAAYLLDGQDSLADVAVNVVRNPLYFLSNLLSADKLVFVLTVLIPLLFLPVVCRRVYEYLLLIPVVVVNLATMYPYQYSIHYQYVFAPGAVLLYLFVRNGARFPKLRSKQLVAAACMGAVLLTNAVSDLFQLYDERYALEADKIAATNTLIAGIDKDLSVRADTYLIPMLYDHAQVYNFDLSVANWADVDCILLDSRQSDYADKLIDAQLKGYAYAESAGYATALFVVGYKDTASGNV